MKPDRAVIQKLVVELAWIQIEDASVLEWTDENDKAESMQALWAEYFHLIGVVYAEK